MAPTVPLPAFTASRVTLPQVNPDKYKSIGNGFSVTVKEDGVRGLAKGWAPTFIGYSMQGLCKFGFYEVFKILYSDLMGEVRAADHLVVVVVVVGDSACMC